MSKDTKKKTTLTLNRKNVELAKENGLNISKYCDEMIAMYVECMNLDQKKLMDELNNIELQETTLKARKQAIKKIFTHNIPMVDDEPKKECGAYRKLATEGVYVESLTKNLIKATGLYRPHFKLLAKYISTYKEKYPERNDFHMFEESVDYLIRRYNQDNPNNKLERNGGYL